VVATSVTFRLVKVGPVNRRTFLSHALGATTAFGALACARTGARAPGAGAPLDLQGLIDRQVRAGKRSVAIPSGRHRVAPVRGQHLLLENLEDVVIDAEGVELVCTQTTRALTVVGCRNVTVKGLVIDYDPLPYTQGRITQLSPDKQVHEIELFDGYPDADGVHACKYEIFDLCTRLLRFGSYYDLTVERVGTRRLRVTKGAAYARQAKPEQAGDLVVIARAHAPGGSVPHAICAERCRDVTFDRVTVYASNCFGFFETACERSRYAYCAVDRRSPESDPVARASPRLRSLNADAFHSKRATVGPEYVGCSAAFNGDDGVAINGDYHLVAGASGRTLRVIAKHSLDVRIGDAVEIVDPHGQRLADARVETIEPALDITDAERELLKTLPMDEGLRTHRDGALTHAFHIALDRAEPLSFGALIGAVGRMGNGFVVRGCRFGHNRSRGLVIKASQGSIAHNEFTENWMEAIKIAPEPWWLEAGSSTDVVILGNTVQGCHATAIEVQARSLLGEVAPAGAHRRIRIESNDIRDGVLPLLSVSSTDGLSIRDNLLAPGPRHDEAADSRDVIKIESCAHALVVGNRPGLPSSG
jgi:hypothetical protein